MKKLSIKLAAVVFALFSISFFSCNNSKTDINKPEVVSINNCLLDCAVRLVESGLPQDATVRYGVGLSKIAIGTDLGIHQIGGLLSATTLGLGGQ